MKIKFIGATTDVTGSMHLLKGKTTNILIDCGLYQGEESIEHNKQITAIISKEKIDALVLTHAHLDHCGYIPKLRKDGFHGPIFSTEVTRDIAEIVLLDNADIQKEKAKESNIQPLYEQIHVHQALGLFKVRDINKAFNWDEFTISFSSAGHILGAVSVNIKNSEQSILFSGDLGKENDILMATPTNPPKAQTLVIESTYGDRNHGTDLSTKEMKKIISMAKKDSSAIIIPAFSVGRSQAIMAFLYDLIKSNPELSIPVYSDSPMTHKVNALYLKYLDAHKLSESKFKKIFNFIHPIKFKKEKDHLDKLQSPRIIITASGMLSGGNALHHLELHAGEERNHLVLAGYQAKGTLGFDIINDAKTFKYKGKHIPIKLTTHYLRNFSSHADQTQLVAWALKCQPKHIYLVHGEQDSKKALKQSLAAQNMTQITIPRALQEFSL